jgi:hypothetical protein
LKTTSLDRLSLNGGLIIAIPAIMPHARERSKRKRDAHRATVFRKAEWSEDARCFRIVIASAAKQ